MRDELIELTLPAGLRSLQTLGLSECRELKKLTLPTDLRSLQTLDLSLCDGLIELTLPTGLRSLQMLDLSGCWQLRELTLSTGLRSLQTLCLFECEQLKELALPNGLRSLQRLVLSGCEQLRRFAPLESLLPTLQELCLFGCKLEDLPTEICGESNDENVLAKIRAHYEDLKAGQWHDTEVMVLFLGNGGTGKTQLCRRLRGLSYDPSVPTTHGIQLDEETMELEDCRNRCG
jgi:internalin A